jgi:hypothetical protein
VLFVRPEPEPVTVAVTDTIAPPERESVMFFDFEKLDVYQVALDCMTMTSWLEGGTRSFAESPC